MKQTTGYKNYIYYNKHSDPLPDASVKKTPVNGFILKDQTVYIEQYDPLTLFQFHQCVPFLLSFFNVMVYSKLGLKKSKAKIFQNLSIVSYTEYFPEVEYIKQ